jgi:hypothetical protein
MRVQESSIPRHNHRSVIYVETFIESIYAICYEASIDRFITGETELLLGSRIHVVPGRVLTTQDGASVHRSAALLT